MNNDRYDQNLRRNAESMHEAIYAQESSHRGLVQAVLYDDLDPRFQNFNTIRVKVLPGIYASIAAERLTAQHALFMDELHKPNGEDALSKRLVMQKDVLRQTLGPRQARWR